MNNIEYTTCNNSKIYKFIKPIGKKILLKKLVKSLDKKYGDIFIPQSVNKNNSFGIAEIIEFGSDSEIKNLGLVVGDFVLYDYFSVFNDNKDYVITNYENIILKLTKAEAEDFINNYII